MRAPEEPHPDQGLLPENGVTMRLANMRKIFHNGRGLRCGWRLLLFCALFFGIGYAVNHGLERLRLPDYPPLHPMDLVIGEGSTLIVALIATALMGVFEKRSLTVYGIPGIRDLFGRFFWEGVIWGALMPSAVILLIFLAGGYKVHGINVSGLPLIKFTLLWIFANLLIGLSEEITFRGYFLYTLSDGIGFLAAATINAVGFGALHYYTKPDERWEDWVAVTLLTFFITLALRRTGSLAFPIGMHAAFDFMFLYVFSGMNAGNFGVGHLLNAEFPGSIRVTGGLLGPEASWFCFLVTAIAIVLLHWSFPDAKWPLPAKEAVARKVS
jgi:membrane protease YdiL (CAAX protease family)